MKLVNFRSSCTVCLTGTAATSSSKYACEKYPEILLDLLKRYERHAPPKHDALGMHDVSDKNYWSEYNVSNQNLKIAFMHAMELLDINMHAEMPFSNAGSTAVVCMVSLLRLFSYF